MKICPSYEIKSHITNVIYVTDCYILSRAFFFDCILNYMESLFSYEE